MELWDIPLKILITYRETFRWGSGETSIAVAVVMLFVNSGKIVIQTAVGGMWNSEGRIIPWNNSLWRSGRFFFAFFGIP